MSDEPRVLIVGGGLAGLSAAVALADQGVRSILFESRPRLGGRASSFVAKETGAPIDNCQHVAMGCCTNFVSFCRTVGVEHLLRREQTLYFIGPDGKRCTFRAWPLPAPLHLAAAFAGLHYLSWGDRISIGRALRVLCRDRSTGRECGSFADWLARQKQSKSSIERFWDVILVSALSETADRIDIRYARQVLVEGFLANRHAWEVLIPAVPLSELYGAPMVRWLQERGTEVRTGCGVDQLELGPDAAASVVAEDGRDEVPIITSPRARAVWLRDGSQIGGDEFILAVPHQRLPDLLPKSLTDAPPWMRLRQLESAPISSVHLWFDRPICDLPHAVLVGRLSQWVFRRSEIGGDVSDDMTEARTAGARIGGGEASQGAPLHYYQVVISASAVLAARSQDEVVAAVVDELKQTWPASADAQLRHGRVVTEHRAVFSPLPGVDEMRPAAQSPIENLQLAGDYTQTGWPATMEGAVISGRMAAANVLARLGRPVKTVSDRLPVSRLSRWLLGIR